MSIFYYCIQRTYYCNHILVLCIFFIDRGNNPLGLLVLPRTFMYCRDFSSRYVCSSWTIYLAYESRLVASIPYCAYHILLLALWLLFLFCTKSDALKSNVSTGLQACIQDWDRRCDEALDEHQAQSMFNSLVNM